MNCHVVDFDCFVAEESAIFFGDLVLPCSNENFFASVMNFPLEDLRFIFDKHP
jgi:hypothetical protein